MQDSEIQVEIRRESEERVRFKKSKSGMAYKNLEPKLRAGSIINNIKTGAGWISIPTNQDRD